MNQTMQLETDGAASWSRVSCHVLRSLHSTLHRVAAACGAE